MNDTLKVTLFGALITVVGWFITHLLSASSEKRCQMRNGQLELIRKQLSELYGPLSFLVVEGRQVYHALAEKLRKHYVEEGASDTLPPEEREAWLSWLSSDLLPRNDRIKKLVAEKSHLIEGETLQVSFTRFLEYHDLWQANYQQLTIRGDFSQWQSLINRPHQFDRDIMVTFNALKKREKILTGSQASTMLPKSIFKSGTGALLPWVNHSPSKALHCKEGTQTWESISETEHFVLFYKIETILLGALSEYVTSGLDVNEPCLMISTQKHQISLEKRLSLQGWNLKEAYKRNEYIWLDAEDVLPRLMVDGEPSQERFLDLVQSTLKQSSKNRRHVRIFGELVALLWLEGNASAALRLEEYWNELQEQTHSFSLFCAYPIHHNLIDTSGFMDVCSRHSHILPDHAENAQAGTHVALI